MRSALLSAALCALTLAPSSVLAADSSALEGQIKALVAKELRAWGSIPAIVSAIEADNAAHEVLTQAQIDALDKAWRAELDQPTRPTIDPILNNKASQVLRAQIDGAGGRVVEAFVMDSRGLNVAVASPTSDYWQGDEDKFLKTFPLGAEAIHIGEVEFDESTQTYEVQVSFTLTDPASGAPIGAITIGLDAETIN